MKESLGNTCEYLFSRSLEAFEKAQLLSRGAHWNTCVNRLYYSCFYSVSALLCKYGLSSAKHSGVRALFNKHFVSTGKIPRETAVIFNALFDRRQESDYGLFLIFEEKDVVPWFDETERFNSAVYRLSLEKDTGSG